MIFPKITHLIYFIFLVFSQNAGQQETEIVLLKQNIKKTAVNNNSFYRFVSLKQINKDISRNGEKQQKLNKCGHSSYTPPRQEQKQEQLQFRVKINVIHGHLVPNATNLPWMALLFYQNDGQLWRYCTMTIISERFLLTAGHCIVDVYQDSPQFNSTGPWPPIYTNRYSILAGVISSENGTEPGNGQQIWRRSKRIYPHTNFEYTDYGWKLNYNDIAIIELDVPLEFNERIQPICLPSSNKSASFNKGDEAIVAGWGFVVRDPENSTNLLHDGYVYGLAWEECKKEDPKFDSTKAICVGGNSKEEGDPCKGDSGGPLMKKQAPDQWTQIGVISGSLGPYCRAPDVMTRISEYCKWIEQITNINCMSD